MATTSPAADDAIHELRRAGVTDLDASTRRRAEYSTDASLYRVVPDVVVFPRCAEEIGAVVEVGRAVGMPLTARGAGTSIAGNAVGPGIVLDFSRHLNRVTDIDPDTATAVVEPGVILDDLQRTAAPHGLRFGPDPSTHSRCTIGGMIGNNACGSRALGYGRTADNVVELELVTGAGEVLRVAKGAGFASATLDGLDTLVQSRLGLIRNEFGRFTRQVSGYSLEHLLPERGFDVAKAFVGTEGTWGLVREATVRLVRAPVVTILLVVGYPDMADAADAIPAILPFRPVAIEGLDARIVDVVRATKGANAVPDLPDGGGWLLVELCGEYSAEVAARAAATLAAAGTRHGWLVRDAREAAALWRIREDGAGLAARTTDPPGKAGWEDAAVPPEHLGDYLREFEALMRERDLTGVPYGHFGDGCIHIRINFPLQRAGGRDVMREFVTDAARLVAGYGGSMSGEHGDGRARGELLSLMYTPEAIDTFGAVKHLFDPDDIMNPGVIVRPRPFDADLREPSALPMRSRLAFGYLRDGGDFSTAVHRCTGVGKCRVTSGAGVMCPSFRATRDEKDSTRGRARVLQELANGSMVRGWRSPEVLDSLDLCLSCKACSSECPTGVDMATLKAEALFQRYRHRPRPAAHYSLGWLPRWARLASVAPGLVNRLMAGPLAPFGKRLAGVDSRRGLPVFAPQTFRSWFAQHSSTAGDPVMLWVDTFTDNFTPEVGIAAVSVLEEAGYSVQIPPRRLCCGLTWISTGQLDTARKMLRRSVDALAATAGAGVPIVGLEPSCTAVFRGDASELLGEGEATVAVSRAMRTLAELLGQTEGWEPPDLSGTSAVVQPHCHHRAVLGFEDDRRILDRAGVATQVVDGCCGLAGNFGAERGHYDVSVAVAENDLLPAVRQADPDSPVLADGFSCRRQLVDLTGGGGIHLAELLASGLRRIGEQVVE